MALTGLASPPAIGPGQLSMRQLLSRLFVAGALVVATAIAVGALAFTNLSSNRHTVIDRIDPADVQVAQLLTAYVDEETGVRGFVLTRESQFLDPYRLGQSNAAAAMASVDLLIPARSRAATLLEAVEQQARAWIGQFAEPAVAATTNGNKQYATDAAQAKGKALFDDLRSRFGALQAELARERKTAVSSLATSSDILGAVLLVAAIVLVVTAGALWRSLHRRVIAALDAVGADARVVTSGQLDHEVRAVGPKEIVDLATEIEAMRHRVLEELATVRAAQDRLAAVNRDLARSNEELEQFAYVASHDLQEPLRKVTSFCQLLSERYAGQLDEQAEEYIAFAVDGSKRMQTLINDLLAFARIGRTTEIFSPVPLRTCIDTALRNLSMSIEETGATITVDDDPPTVVGDRNLLTVLVQTLIHNSIKFHAEVPPTIGLGWRRDEGEWIVAVEDNGIGVEPRYADRIFVIFQRLHGRNAYSGTGIGLALAKKIVEFHGGRIWLDSDHTPGTRICFALPVRQLEGDG